MTESHVLAGTPETDGGTAALPAARRAYRELESLIVTLKLAPGSLTTEGALSARTGYGRTPLREAIQRLAWEGLVEIRPRAGLAIAALDPQDWVRVLDTRLGVEMLLARSAARRSNSETAERFRAIGDQMRRVAEEADVLGFLEADKELDEALSDFADNRFAATLAAPLQTHSRRFWFRYQGTSGLERAAQGHMRVIDAIISGNQYEAGAAASSLIGALREQARAASR